MASSTNAASGHSLMPVIPATLPIWNMLSRDSMLNAAENGMSSVDFPSRKATMSK